MHGLASSPAAWEWRKRVREVGELEKPRDANCSNVGHEPSRVDTPYPNWLRDFLPMENLGARIMTFNHNTAWESNALSKSLEDCGQDLLRALGEVRSTEKVGARGPSRKLIQLKLANSCPS